MKLWEIDQTLTVPWSDDETTGEVSRKWVKERRRLARSQRRKFKSRLKRRRGWS